MITVSKIQDLRNLIREERLQGGTIGLVPTMGYLHNGHLSLVEAACRSCSLVVMSIFVNPLQFGPNEDFETYPRNIERDSALAEGAGVDILFMPSVEEMYPQSPLTFVDVQKITDDLCGVSRPGHFRGVATVVNKLFNIVQPDKAFFGQKDAQQVRVLEQMVEDLNMPVNIVACPIVREEDGLALSSRNVYLLPEERKQALALSRSIREAETRLIEGERDVKHIRDLVIQVLSQEPLIQIEYVRILDAKTFEENACIERPALLAMAVRIGKTRLIDNTVLQP